MNAPTPVRWRCAILPALLAVVVYLNALGNGFAYDDVPIIQGDTAIHSLSNVPQLFARNYWSDDTALALYRPLTSASFALDWTLSHGHAAWFHAVNIIWHALATALATLLLATLFGGTAALAGGLLFALHPVHVEAVANVVGRADIMAAATVFAAALVWLHATGAARIIGVLALYILGLLFKESVIGLPLLLPLLDIAAGRLAPKEVGAWVRRHAAAFLALGITGVAYLGLRATVLGAMTPTRVDPALEVAVSAPDRILTALQAWPHIVRLMVFPLELLADYDPRIIMPADSLRQPVLLGLVLLVALLGGGLLAFALQHRRIAFVLLWAPLALLPVSNFIVPIGVLVAERILYVPSLAICAAAGIAFAAASRHTAQPRRTIVLVAAALVLAAGAVRTWTRTPVWHSTDEVLGKQLEDRPESFRAQWHHARVLRAAGRPRDALATYRTAVELWPYRRGLIDEAAAFEAGQGQLQQARAMAAVGVRRWPDDLTLTRLGAGASLDLGDTLAARRFIEHGLRLAPADPLLLRMRAFLDGTSK